MKVSVSGHVYTIATGRVSTAVDAWYPLRIRPLVRHLADDRLMCLTAPLGTSPQCPARVRAPRAALAGPMCCKPGTVSVVPCGGARFCPFCLARPIFTEDPASGEDRATPVARIFRNGRIFRGNGADAPPGVTRVKQGECCGVRDTPRGPLQQQARSRRRCGRPGEEQALTPAVVPVRTRRSRRPGRAGHEVHRGLDAERTTRPEVSRVAVLSGVVVPRKRGPAHARTTVRVGRRWIRPESTTARWPRRRWRASPGQVRLYGLTRHR